MKYRKIAVLAAVLVLLCSIVAVIFYFSSQYGSTSHILSRKVGNRIADYINIKARLSLTEPQYFNLKVFTDVSVRKAAHFCEYAAVGLFAYAGAAHMTRRAWLRGLLVLLIVFLIGGADELHQLSVAGREGRWTDVMIDLVGGGVGLFIGWIFNCTITTCFKRNNKTCLKRKK